LLIIAFTSDSFFFCYNFSGFVRGMPEELAVSISFKPSFEEGSLLTVVCWQILVDK